MPRVSVAHALHSVKERDAVLEFGQSNLESLVIYATVCRCESWSVNMFVHTAHHIASLRIGNEVVTR